MEKQIIKFVDKGQLISKCLFGVLNSSKKLTWSLNFCPSLLGQKFLVRFFEELKTQKSPFEINCSLEIAFFKRLEIHNKTNVVLNDFVQTVHQALSKSLSKRINGINSKIPHRNSNIILNSLESFESKNRKGLFFLVSN